MTPSCDGEQRRQRLLALLGAADTRSGDPAATGRSGPERAERSGPGGGAGRTRSWLGRLCASSVSEARVSGAGITVMAGVRAGGAEARDQVCATGGRTRPLEDLQMTTGEGPCVDAYTSGVPVLVAELAGETDRWPGYGPEALGGGTAAVFSLPLQVGAVRLGTLDLNRDTVGPLSATEFADALVLAGLATETLLELAGDPDAVASPDPADAGPDAVGADPGDSAGRTEETVGWLPGVHGEVHQASGMVSVQTGCGVGDALLRIRAYAFTSGVPITEVARQVVARELVLDADGP